MQSAKDLLKWSMQQTRSKVRNKGKCSSLSSLNFDGKSARQLISSSRSKRLRCPLCDFFSLASFASSSLVLPAADRESSNLEKYSSTLPARTLDWVTKICRGLSIESCFNLNVRSIPNILNSIVVVFLRELRCISSRIRGRQDDNFDKTSLPGAAPSKDITRIWILNDFLFLRPYGRNIK